MIAERAIADPDPAPARAVNRAMAMALAMCRAHLAGQGFSQPPPAS